jgi:hypothetical protein
MNSPAKTSFELIPMKDHAGLDSRNGEYWVRITYPNGEKECIGKFENSFIGEQAAEKWIMDNRDNIIVLGDGCRIATKST